MKRPYNMGGRWLALVICGAFDPNDHDCLAEEPSREDRSLNEK
jgi:hypothetical protein